MYADNTRVYSANSDKYIRLNSALKFCELKFRGSPTTSLIHPRDVINPAIRESATSVIFLHNHPSGDPEPSVDDTFDNLEALQNLRYCGNKCPP